MAPIKQKPIKKIKQPSSDEEEDDEDIEIDSEQMDQDDFDSDQDEIDSQDIDESGDDQELEDNDDDESLNSDEIPNLSISEDEDKDRKKGKFQNMKIDDDSNSVLGDLQDDEDDDVEDDEDEEDQDSENEQQDLDNIESEYSDEEDNEKDKELFQQNINSQNYFEKILKLNKLNINQIEGIELESDLLKMRPLMKVEFDKEEIYKNDEPEFQKMIDELIKNSKEEESKLHPLTKLTRSRNLNLEQGIGLLNSKNEIFANYLICLNFYMLYKLNGISLKDSPVVKKLIYYKTLLSKLKPVEKKMEYQISKLMKQSLKASEKGAVTSTMKPHPELIPDGNEEQEEISENVSNVSEDEDQDQPKQKKTVESKKPAKYVVPKTRAHYQEKDKIEQRMQVEKKRRIDYLSRKLKDNINADINEFKNDRPLVERFAEKDKHSKLEKEKRQYEETHFTRLQVGKKEKKRLKEIEKNKQKLDRIDDMQELQDYRELLHHQKLTNDPAIERKENERLESQLQKYNNKNKKFSGSKNNFSKMSKPQKKFKKN